MNYIIFTVIVGIALAYIIVHSFAELWEEDKEIDCTPFGRPWIGSPPDSGWTKGDWERTMKTNPDMTVITTESV